VYKETNEMSFNPIANFKIEVDEIGFGITVSAFTSDTVNPVKTIYQYQEHDAPLQTLPDMEGIKVFPAVYIDNISAQFENDATANISSLLSE
jgi:hypothetical protein